MPQLQVQNGSGLICGLFGIGSGATTSTFNYNLDRVLTSSADQTQSWREFQLDRDFATLRARLRELRNLRQGWDSYGSEAPSEESRTRAERILGFLRSEKFLPTGVVPSAEGGVGICFVWDGGYADIECLNTGEILAVAYKGADRPTVWEFEYRDAAIRNGIDRLRRHISD